MRGKFLMYAALALALAIAAFLHPGWNAGQLPADPAGPGPSGERPGTADRTEAATLTIWSPAPVLAYEIRQFEIKYPGITVEFVNMQDEPRLTDRYLDALAEGSGPDMLILPLSAMGAFNTIDLLADLDEAGVNTEKYRDRMGEYIWDIHHKLGSDKMFAMPFEVYPLVLYYRHDIMQDNGLPDDPGQLADFLADADRWVEIARQLAGKGIYIQQWQDELLGSMHQGEFMFDHSLGYARHDDRYRTMTDLAIRTRPYSASVSLWNENGRQMLRDGKIAMFVMPAWAEDHLASWVPEQRGLWRATRLPAGLAGIHLETSKSIVINGASPNVDWAAAFVTFVMDSSTVYNWFEWQRPSPAIGDQNSKQLYLSMIREYDSDTVPTPLDDRVFSHWRLAIMSALYNNLSTADAMAAAEQAVTDLASVSLDLLKQYLMLSEQ